MESPLRYRTPDRDYFIDLEDGRITFSARENSRPRTSYEIASFTAEAVRELIDQKSAKDRIRDLEDRVRFLESMMCPNFLFSHKKNQDKKDYTG